MTKKMTQTQKNELFEGTLKSNLTKGACDMNYIIIKKRKYLPYTIDLPVKSLECSRDIQNWLTNWQGCKTRQSVKGWFIEALIPVNNLNNVIDAMPGFGWI